MTQHKDSAIMTQLQLRNWLIDREIELLSTRHDLDRGRVRAILEKTYDDTYAPSLEGFSTPFTSSTVAELLQSNLDSFFTPSLRDAIKHMEPESALSLFEQSMPKLTKQLLIFDYLTDVTIPYRTLNELQQFTQTALNYLERNREAILCRTSAKMGHFGTWN